MPEHRPAWVLYGDSKPALDQWRQWFEKTDNSNGRYNYSNDVHRIERLRVNVCGLSTQVAEINYECSVFVAYANVPAVLKLLDTADLEDPRDVIHVKFSNRNPASSSAPYMVRGASGLGKSFLTSYFVRGFPTLRILETDSIATNQHPLPDPSTFDIVVIGNKHRIHTKRMRRWTRQHAHVDVWLYTPKNQASLIWRWYKTRRRARLERLLLRHLPRVLVTMVADMIMMTTTTTTTNMPLVLNQP
jgi:hypothetical protein